MIKQDIYHVHFEKYLELKRDCDAYIRQGIEGTGRCFERIRDYLEDFGLENDADSVTQLEGRFSELKAMILKGTESREIENLHLNKVNYSILSLVNSHKPNGISDYGKNSLRKNSGWDERENLIAFILFFNENESEHIFRKLLKNKNFNEVIKIERFYTLDGEKVIIPNEFDPLADSYGEMDDNEVDFVEVDGKRIPIESRPLYNEKAVRYERRDLDGFLIAEAIVEKKATKNQIWISTNGKERCEFINELIDWFQKAIAPEDSAICVPQTIELFAFKYSESEISLRLKQPV